MADKAQEVQVRDFNIGSGWETFMENYLRAIVTDVEDSAIQAHAAKILLASVKAKLKMRQGTYIVFS